MPSSVTAPVQPMATAYDSGPRGHLHAVNP